MRVHHLHRALVVARLVTAIAVGATRSLSRWQVVDADTKLEDQQAEHKVVSWLSAVNRALCLRATTYALAAAVSTDRDAHVEAACERPEESAEQGAQQGSLPTV